MFDNQYIITKTKPDGIPSDLKHVSFGDLSVYTHTRLKCTIAHGAHADVLMLGVAVNPFQVNEYEADISQRIADTCQSKRDFFCSTEELTGRYIIIYRSANDMVMVGDPCHLRQMFYGHVGNNVVVTSSVKLFLASFKLTPKINPEKKEFINSDIYRSKHALWYGDQTMDDRLRRLLANHYLDVQSATPYRLPVTVIVPTNDEDAVIAYSKNILENTFEALLKQYKLMLAVTAGVDSRALLAASRKYQDQIDYYILHDKDTDPSDISVSTDLTKKLGIKFSVIPIAPLRQDFIEKFSAEYVEPIVQPGLVHIQHYYDQKYDSTTLNVNGTAAEIVRSFFGDSKKLPSVDTLYLFSKYDGKSPYVRKEIEKWYIGAKDYAAAMNISLLDLFYWEQRMSIWGAHYRAEQDMAMEEIAPFNNRKLLLAMATLPASERSAFGYKAFRKLISSMWKETLLEPINPNASAYKIFIKSNATLYSTYLKMTALIKRFRWRKT